MTTRRLDEFHFQVFLFLNMFETFQGYKLQKTDFPLDFKGATYCFLLLSNSFWTNTDPFISVSYDSKCMIHFEELTDSLFLHQKFPRLENLLP